MAVTPLRRCRGTLYLTRFLERDPSECITDCHPFDTAASAIPHGRRHPYTPVMPRSADNMATIPKPDLRTAGARRSEIAVVAERCCADHRAGTLEGRVRQRVAARTRSWRGQARLVGKFGCGGVDPMKGGEPGQPTGLYNRRYFEQAVARKSRAPSANGRFGIVFRPRTFFNSGRCPGQRRDACW